MGQLGLGLVLVLQLGLGLALGLQLGIGIGFRRNHSWSSTFTPRRNHSLCLYISLLTQVLHHYKKDMNSVKMSVFQLVTARVQLEICKPLLIY